MNRDSEDEKLESYLRQFQARAPKPLPRVASPTRFRRSVMPIAAAAAVFLLAIAIFLMRGRQVLLGQKQQLVAKQEPAPQQISMFRLSRLAQEDPEKLGPQLDELSARLLPDVRSSKGVLKQLARE